jgi:hypothetical protein
MKQEHLVQCPYCRRLVGMDGCHNCKHFVQHYVQSPELSERYTPCHVGHCVATNRIKQRTPWDRACEHHECREGAGDEQREDHSGRL